MQRLATHLILCFVLLSSILVKAQQVQPASAKAIPLEPRYLARIELNTAAELQEALLRAEALAREEQPSRPIAFVLHGKEVYSLLSDNREKHLALFSLAEKLSQQDVVRIQVCSSWLVWQRINDAQLPRFVDKIEYAPTEIDRLIQKEGYTYF